MARAFVTIGAVREIYRGLRDRCLVAHPQHHDYINGLWSSWDAALAEMGRETIVQDFWSMAVLDPELRPDDLLAWLDAYPDGVRDRVQGVFA